MLWLQISMFYCQKKQKTFIGTCFPPAFVFQVESKQPSWNIPRPTSTWYRPWGKLHSKVPLASDRRWVLRTVTDFCLQAQGKVPGKEPLVLDRWWILLAVTNVCLQALRKAPQQSAVGFRRMVSLCMLSQRSVYRPWHEKSSTAADSESFSAGSHIITGICQIMQVTQMTWHS